MKLDRVGIWGFALVIVGVAACEEHTPLPFDVEGVQDKGRVGSGDPFSGMEPARRSVYPRVDDGTFVETNRGIEASNPIQGLHFLFKEGRLVAYDPRDVLLCERQIPPGL